jgi:hypothetical protein
MLSVIISVMATIIPLKRHPNLRGFLRPGRSTAGRLKALIAAGAHPCDGLVLDAALWSRLSDLADAAAGARIETVLDPRSLELASEGGRARGAVAGLAWAGRVTHSREALRSRAARAELVGPIADFVATQRLDAVLAPTHFLETVEDEWLDIDDALTRELREVLDGLGRKDALVYRPVYLPSRLLSSRLGPGDTLAARFKGTATDALWLGVHPFGTSAGPLAIRRYVDFCRALHAAELPIVAMHSGTVGMLLMALGAVSAIESGVTDGENFDADALTRRPRVPRDGEKVIGATPRVYLHTLGAFVTTKEAQAFFAVRGMTSSHACQSACCPHGVEDMVSHRIGHFAMRRQAEIEGLARIPSHKRAKVWVDTELRPASDRAIAAERAHPRLRSVRKRLDDWRRTASGILDLDAGVPTSVARGLPGTRQGGAPVRMGGDR